MKNLLKKLSIFIVSIFIVFVGAVNMCFAGQDSPHDQVEGISGDSYRSKQEAERGNDENARENAQKGFDTERSSNLGHGNYYIPNPKPVIEKNKE
ncbi:hypothetical protein [Sulfurihydrogenibium azorense]|uniref:hypothetical protein n=1 Tax=Sulfurihydrogenibium azorense TaxID=309806 RepID=UPI00391DC5E3